MKAIILAGGSGTRLWPLSRSKKPKQFQSLTSDKTLFQEAIERISFLKPENIYIACNKNHHSEVQKQAPHIPSENIIIEPAICDTASCIGLAAVKIGKKYPHEVMCVIYADHLIKNKDEFVKKLKAAEKIAQKEHTLNIIEVKATSPNPHLGYVKIGKLLKEIDGNEIYELEAFIEKPSRKKAEQLLKSYKYLWNTGYFVWRVKDILDQYKTLLPMSYKGLMRIQKALDTKNEKKIIETEYPKLQKISIDYGIMEKVDPKMVRIIPANLGWSDIGNFEALFNELTKAKTENLIKGPTIEINTKGSLIYNFGRSTIATIGIKDTIIVQTEDAILICPKNQSKELKKLIEALKKKYPKLL